LGCFSGKKRERTCRESYNAMAGDNMKKHEEIRRPLRDGKIKQNSLKPTRERQIFSFR
jgi:hypothetical protein